MEGKKHHFPISALGELLLFLVVFAHPLWAMGFFIFFRAMGCFFFEKEVNSFKDGVWRFKQQKKPVKLFA